MDIKMDITKIQNGLSKLDMYKNSQINDMISIKSHLKKLAAGYSSNNTRKINDQVSFITGKFTKLREINNRDTYVINKNVSAYISTAKSVTKKFGEIR